MTSGDRHGARGFKVPRPNGFHFYEFEPASLGGLLGPKLSDLIWDTQLFGAGGKYANGELTFDTSLKDLMATFRLLKENGDIIYELSLKTSELTPKNYK